MDRELQLRMRRPAIRVPGGQLTKRDKNDDPARGDIFSLSSELSAQDTGTGEAV